MKAWSRRSSCVCASPAITLRALGANGEARRGAAGAADDRRHLPEESRRPHPDQDRSGTAVPARNLVAAEDRDFYSHFGVSPKSIARAIWVNLGRHASGRQYLTQQLVKNFFLTSERSLSRKLTEAMMAVLLELHYDKREILEATSTKCSSARTASARCTVSAWPASSSSASRCQELKLHQIALLVGMVKGPSYYNPRRYPERALQRRNLVLDLLAEQGVASQEVVDAAKKMPLGVTKRGSLADSSFPAFLDLVKRQLRQDYRDEDLTEEGLRIFTSFDPILQMKAETAMSETFKRLAGRKGADEVEVGDGRDQPGNRRSAGADRQPSIGLCRLQPCHRRGAADRLAGQAGGLPDRA
jgi:hypothetical protein